LNECRILTQEADNNYLSLAMVLIKKTSNRERVGLVVFLHAFKFTSKVGPLFHKKIEKERHRERNVKTMMNMCGRKA